VVAILFEAALADARPRATRLDPTWPPVLIAFVGAAVGAVIVMIVVVAQRLRADARRQACRQGGAQ
jgi:uncharacterized integral membrane protein